MAKEEKYTREALLKSELFAAYQQDFVSVLLKEPEYTISEAKKIVEDYFGGEN